jgi:hypothetical protein
VSGTSSRPLGLRLLNGVGGALRAAGLPVVRLDEASLLAEASRRARLDDFGDDGFRDPLRRLLASYESEARLTLLGRLIARRDAVRLLENRLHLVDTCRRHPEIAAAPVRAPIVVVGLPRTGTTVLHALLGQDPENRVPMTWEVMHPWPAPERATYDTDPRIAQVERHFAGVDRVIPGFKSMHPMGALLPQECVALTAHEFATMIYHTANRVPSYQRWLDGADLRWVYRAHRRWLQYLQWRCPGERWVLKSPGHLWAIDALLGEYPDVRIVQTHRDPLKVVASLASLVAALRSMATDDVDPHEIGADWTARLADGLERGMAARASGLLPPSQVLDVQFHDLVRDEIATVRRIYSHFGLTLSPDAEARMRAFLAANPPEKHGAHRYALAAAGLDQATERRRYVAYEARFGIPREVVD